MRDRQMRQITGREAFLEVLADEGVTHLFGNPGTTELPLMQALPQVPALRYVLGLQESVVVAMADGFSRSTGALTAVNLHCMPGLGHAMGAIHAARFSGSPIIITAGQYEIGYGLQEPLLYEPLVEVAAPLVKWSFEIQRLADIPRVVRRAAKVAMASPRGPVFLSLPASVLDEEGEIDLLCPTRVEERAVPDAPVLERLVARCLAASRPVILAGRELAEQDAFEAACAFAEWLGAAVYLDSVPYNSRFPVEHPCHMGEITRNQRKVRATLEPHDLLICLGGDLLRMSAFSTVDPLPPSCEVIHLSARDWELGKNYPTDLAVRVHLGSTLVVLLEALRARSSATQRAAATARIAALKEDNWLSRRAAAVAKVASSTAQAAQDSMIDPAAMMLALSDALPEDALIVEEAPTTAAHLHTFLRVRRPLQAFGLSSGGLGFALPGAVGMALAHPGRRVVAVLGDGSAMYAIQGLWTAAHLKLSVSFVIANNRSYRIIKDRLVALRDADHFIGMDLRDPLLDFPALASGMGVASRSVTRFAELSDALAWAFSTQGPTLLDVQIASGYDDACTGGPDVRIST